MNIRQLLKDKKLKSGSYSMVVTAAVVIIVILINLLVGEIPSKYIKIDMSSEKLYTISRQTKELVSGLTKDVTLYYIVQEGNEDTAIAQLLDRYEDLSSHIKVVYKDPVLYPTFTSKYTDGNITENSIIVESDLRTKVIDYDSFYEYAIDYTTYSQEVTGFDGEGQLTSGIDYVVSEELPKMYILSGHNEGALSTSLEEAITKKNIEMEKLELLTLEAVPEDCDCLLIFSPLNDISQAEAAMIKTYLAAGGNAFIVSNYSEEEMPNLDSVLAEYGVAKTEGIIVEGNSNYYFPGYAYYVVPDLNSMAITSPLISAGMNVLVPIAQGIEQVEGVRETLQIESLMTTSESAYGKVLTDDTTTMEKSDGDIEGPFDLGVAITDTADEVETKIVYLTSEGIFDDSINEQVSGGNYDLILNSLSWMCQQDSKITIHAKTLSTDTLVLTESQASFWSFITVIFLPVIILCTGIVIWIKRRKK